MATAADEKGSHESQNHLDNDSLKFKHPPRPWYLRVPFASTKASPLKHGDMDDLPMIPEASANFFSLVTFGWMSSILSLGYARPLDMPDLYTLQDDRSASYISKLIDESFERRRKTAEEYNKRLTNGEIEPGWTRSIWWSIRGNRSERERHWRSVGGQKRASLTFALNDSVKWWFWSAGLLRVISDTLIITSPLLVQAIINFAGNSYEAISNGETPPPLLPGVFMAVGLFLMQLVASLCTHHYWYRATSTGGLLRGGLVASIYSRAFRLSSRARVTLSSGQLVTHIAADVSRIDTNAALAHIAWSALVQIIISLIILLHNLGPSALAGFSLFLMGIPVQSWIMKRSYVARTSSMQYTDKRVKLTQDLLNGIRVLKFFAWEKPFLTSLTEIRKNEMRYVRKLLMIRAGNNAVAASFPVLATVLSFICYSLTGHSLNPGIVFSSLTLFQLLKTPVQLLPIAFSSITDAYNAISRLYAVFAAETASDDRIVDPTAELGVEVKGANFTWEVPAPSSEKKKKPRRSLFRKKGRKAQEIDPRFEDSSVFKMDDINLSIPRGQLCAIVGPVGSGKSSLLQGLVGEMRKTSGTITLGGSVSYCPQSAWIQNGTVRENICFGKPFDSDRYWRAVRDSCLEKDLTLFPQGDMTEIGEKGVSLSGGQKQRLNICRSIYADTDVQIFDDPLSALDAHVGKEVFLNVLKTKIQKTTRILVTHAIHLLPQVDYIITINQGRIVERGTYAELISNEKGAFAKFIKEFELDKGEDEEEIKEAEVKATPKETTDKTKTPSTGSGTALMQEEERVIGSVSNDVYLSYFRAGKGQIFIPLILASLLLFQTINVLSSYWLIYWNEEKWPQPQGFYISIYAVMGVVQAGISFILGSLFAIQAYCASRELHRSSIDRVMHAPTSFFETTPLGRIMNRFSKDIDSVDNFLADAWSTLANSVGSILGAMVLISAIFPWFLIPVAILFACFFYYSLFYRASARELNRMNSLLRSKLVTHFSESLSGLTTIRAYGEFERFRLDNVKRTDIENRAYWLTVANGRWLAIRLDAFGTSLVFIVALIVVLGRHLIPDSQSGLMLSYILSIQSSLSLVVRQGAQVEIFMNSVERVVHYAKEVEQEAFEGDKDSQPQASWPSTGKIEFKNLHLSYRPGLPAVLKGLNMNIAAGEKLGIVGRTGAGKSSIMVALYRLVESSVGSIDIDGVDISKLDLETLRRSIAIIPQEAILFPGTVRSNLDPFGQHDDAQLWDALHRAHLLDDKSNSEKSYEDTKGISSSRFSLDAQIDNDGSNLSMGERSLISLARALVKKCRVLVLDEATASVDYETDKKIQDTIAEEFSEQTILCIAHRLNTIIGYDRVCVMDAGRVAELDTPATLFQQGGIFRSMCDQSGISLVDILLAQKARDS